MLSTHNHIIYSYYRVAEYKENRLYFYTIVIKHEIKICITYSLVNVHSNVLHVNIS